jgi:hypothetical protein
MWTTTSFPFSSVETSIEGFSVTGWKSTVPVASECSPVESKLLRVIGGSLSFSLYELIGGIDFSQLNFRKRAAGGPLPRFRIVNR